MWLFILFSFISNVSPLKFFSEIFKLFEIFLFLLLLVLNSIFISWEGIDSSKIIIEPTFNIIFNINSVDVLYNSKSSLSLQDF